MTRICEPNWGRISADGRFGDDYEGDALEMVVMLRKRKEPKAKKSMVEALMRDMQGSAAKKLALFEKLKAAGGFAHATAAELRKVESMLRTFAAMERE